MEQTQAYNGVLDLLVSMTAGMANAKGLAKPSGKDGEASDFHKLLDQTAQNQTAGQTQGTKDGQIQTAGQEQGEGQEEQPVLTDPMAQQRQMELAAALVMQSPAAQNLQPAVEAEQPQLEAAPVPVIAMESEEVQQELPGQQIPQQTALEARQIPTAQPEAQAEEPVQQTVQPEAKAVSTAQTGQEQPEQIRQTAEKPVRQTQAPQAQQEQSEEEEPGLTIDRPESQPVFRQENATYVKVSEAAPAEQTPEDQPAEKQVAIQLEKALETGESKVQIHLTPSNLGSVQVEITRRADGIIHVVLTAEKAQTQSLLEKHAAGLQSMVAERSQEQVTVQVERREDSQGYYEGHNSQSEQNGQENQRQHRRQDRQQPQDFLQQLRLGLTPLETL